MSSLRTPNAGSSLRKSSILLAKEASQRDDPFEDHKLTTMFEERPASNKKKQGTLPQRIEKRKGDVDETTANSESTEMEREDDIADEEASSRIVVDKRDTSKHQEQTITDSNKVRLIKQRREETAIEEEQEQQESISDSEDQSSTKNNRHNVVIPIAKRIKKQDSTAPNCFNFNSLEGEEAIQNVNICKELISGYDHKVLKVTEIRAYKDKDASLQDKNSDPLQNGQILDDMAEWIQEEPKGVLAALRPSKYTLYKYGVAASEQTEQEKNKNSYIKGVEGLQLFFSLDFKCVFDPSNGCFAVVSQSSDSDTQSSSKSLYFSRETTQAILEQALRQQERDNNKSTKL